MTVTVRGDCEVGVGSGVTSGDTSPAAATTSVPSSWTISGAIAPAYKLHPNYGYLPETSGFLGKWRMAQNKSNDYLLDRDFQKNGSYTGIMGIGIQESLQRLNAVKNALAGLVNAVAAVVFIAVAHVDWAAAGLVAAGSVVGGQIGATVGRRLPPLALRVVIVVVGAVAVVSFVGD